MNSHSSDEFTVNDQTVPMPMVVTDETHIVANDQTVPMTKEVTPTINEVPATGSDETPTQDSEHNVSTETDETSILAEVMEFDEDTVSLPIPDGMDLDLDDIPDINSFLTSIQTFMKK